MTDSETNPDKFVSFQAFTVYENEWNSIRKFFYHKKTFSLLFNIPFVSSFKQSSFISAPRLFPGLFKHQWWLAKSRLSTRSNDVYKREKTSKKDDDFGRIVRNALADQLSKIFSHSRPSGLICL